jgi:hypothetical protein
MSFSLDSLPVLAKVLKLDTENDENEFDAIALFDFNSETEGGINLNKGDEIMIIRAG